MISNERSESSVLLSIGLIVYAINCLSSVKLLFVRQSDLNVTQYAACKKVHVQNCKSRSSSSFIIPNIGYRPI